MQAVVLTIHLVVCVCLIGLVLLQRSEGGALGMGGGGSGALMSGRGAADALARMTQMAGGAFLITSLLLTVLSGAASSDSRSVFDLIPHTQSAPAPVTTTTPAPVSPASPDPTQSAAPEAAQTQLAAISTTTTVVPAPTAAAGEHAAPLTASATPARSQPASTQPARTQPAATLDQSRLAQKPDCVADRVTRHAVGLAQLHLGRQQRTNRIATRLDFLAQDVGQLAVAWSRHADADFLSRRDASKPRSTIRQAPSLDPRS